MPFDLLVVGGGPAGLAAAIKFKQVGFVSFPLLPLLHYIIPLLQPVIIHTFFAPQLAIAADKDLSVCVLEKGAEVGAHILSGNVFEPRSFEELFPDVSKSDVLDGEGASIFSTPVTEDKFIFLTSETGSAPPIPNLLLPSQLHNDGNYVISLGQLCRYMGAKAEEIGVEVFAGFAASEVLYGADNKTVEGIATRDVGISKDGTPSTNFERGMELRARQTLFAEGARGSCSEELIDKFGLREANDAQPQTYGLGVKEVWEIPESQCEPGFVQHTIGWPLQDSPLSKTFGGSFLYHQAPNKVLLGFVVGLDYENPHLSPYKEFQVSERAKR